MNTAGTHLCLFAAFCLATVAGMAAEYYVALDGNDANPGGATLPWRTIQKGANSMVAGDAVIVRAGSYTERVSTVRAGTEPNRITFQAKGAVVMKGWVINHAYVTVRGFEIAGHSAASTWDAHIRVNSGGSRFELIDCCVRDGVQVARPDMMFHSGSNTITSAVGGFLAAGFAAGQSLWVGPGANRPTIANAGLHTIMEVTDTTITVASLLATEGPMTIYLSASYVYGLSLLGGPTNCVIRGNTFRNLGYDAWFINGMGHLVESNRIEQANGWDAMHYAGTNHLFRGNIIWNSPLLVYQPSPDAMENYGSIPYSNITFSNNLVYGFAGVLGTQKGHDVSSELLFTRNVFVDVSIFWLAYPRTTVEQNTFLRVARKGNPVVSLMRHPILITTSVGATNVAIRNNLFVDCGEYSGASPASQVGWYQIDGPTNFVFTGGNFVAGSPPGYGAKTNFNEGNALFNGGDPGFVNINDPLGPDGIPFTYDDGLRLLPTSKLIGAGPGGSTPGAYAPVLPQLSLALLGNQVQLAWPATSGGWFLQNAPTVFGGWTNVPSPPTTNNGFLQVSHEAGGTAGFFRLAR